MNSLRLHLALIILYLLFTCPRSAIICHQGVFATSRHSAAAAAAAGETASNGDVIFALLESLSRLAHAIYKASLLPLLVSYHYNFRRILVNSCPFCCRCCCSRHYTAPIVDKTSDGATATTPAATHGSARKSVKFDMQAVEFEIQYEY